MNVIKSMAARFNKLWRWIKETAWVQPLLIVGAIFAIIFSIPKFTTWFEAMGIGSSDSYYTNFKLSLEGEVKDPAHESLFSQADKLTSAINKFSFAQAKEQGTNKYDAYRAELEEAGIIRDYGEKFFVIYVESTCESCTDVQSGFEALTKGWNTTYAINDSREFKLYSIYADETSSNDADYLTDDDSKAFYRYLNNFTGFWEEAAGRLEDAPYKSNAGISDSYYDNIEKVNCASWQVPTIFLIDFSKEAWAAGRVGISDVLFGVTGNTAIEKALLLQKMWNHLPTVEWKDNAWVNVPGSEDTTNAFRAEYKKNA